MFLLTYRSCVILFVLFILSSPLESCHCGRCKLSDLSCDEAKTNYIDDNCDQYDPEEVNNDLQKAKYNWELDRIVTQIKCKVYKSKNDLCDLTKDIKHMLRTNCSNKS
ncbi:uncharacterized protein LOC110460668 [Mizuhopecten yessoensis]|uniref:uncharacterized protein LOC110460668 n=1 Tax=Mizuhopecten yessoensis TaxID=6573 RepID=UPI000B45CB06|nr:uncharacterized protein LOC110460668 [Mizuhopecten yessoensis]